ncbi:sirohydrochlorin chelatase [Streptantibioticus rubrisoli]|uniref:Sirohydrochlorin chelatase n=1 Tax=Streptantibioticus rubrisoli TaxID=1387313 RepID=A0ABT1PEP7_9ACTN|nr:sirohydrochlorin chelatase [Streptantibioticus rubrisoli]MCQ4042703.1 sirohydrochlorin chelatase [Streptantibioticus rubrisoli]
MSPPALIAVAHGTRDPAGAAAVRQLLDTVGRLRPGSRVEVGHLDLLRPSLYDVLARRRDDVVLVPLLLGAGYHVHTDIPAVVAAAGCRTARVSAALGPDPLLATVLSDRLTEAGWSGAREDGAVVLAAAGSTDQGANADTLRMARLLQTRLGCPVTAGYLCAASPTPAEAVAALRARGHREVAVARYLLAPGFFAQRASASGACLTSPPLGAHEAVARLVLRRYDEVLG